MVGIHNDLAVLIKEMSQGLAGAPSNALLLRLFKTAAPFKMKTNVWARLRGQKEQLTIQVRSAVKQPWVQLHPASFLVDICLRLCFTLSCKACLSDYNVLLALQECGVENTLQAWSQQFHTA